MHSVLFLPMQTVRSRVSDTLSQALCNLSLAFLADFTLSDSTVPIHFIVKLFSLASYTLLFVWIERQDHSVHMSSVLQVQHLYTAGIPLLEAYLLPVANRLATHCPCGQPFIVSHAFSCPKGAMPSIRHNAIRDITAQLLTEVCPNICVEPTLQPLTGESFPLRSTNTEEGARLDIKAQNFWDKSKQSTFFDVRIFNSHAPANCSSSTDACY